MARKQDRSNAYFAKRLSKEHPGIYADYHAGKYTSLHQALVAAGLRNPPTPLRQLKKNWNRASKSEQQAFLQWLIAQGVLTATRAAGAKAPSASRKTTSPVDANGKLHPWAKNRIEHIMRQRNLKPGDVLHELGKPKLNPSLGLALQRNSAIRDTNVVSALVDWLNKNAHV